MAKNNTVIYRLIDSGKSPFRFSIQLKKWWGWKTVETTKNYISLDCESEADYWMKKNNPNSLLEKKGTVK